MKMYVCVLDEFPDYMTPTLVGHAVLRHHLAMLESAPPVYEFYENWLHNSFKKCVVRVTRNEFDKILLLPNIVQSWENNTLEGKTSCITIVVDDNIPNVLKFAKLWKPSPQNHTIYGLYSKRIVWEYDGLS